MKQLVEQFCTPFDIPFAEFEKKEIPDIEKFEIPFESSTLKCYSIGTGKTVIIAHGWGSRAGHFFLMAKYISNAGFRCICFDAPAHFSYGSSTNSNKSNMFEFGKAVCALAKNFTDVHAIIGHSLGAIASAFSISGYLKFKEYKIKTEKLILISCPLSLERIIYSFCNRLNLENDKFTELWNGLEEKFEFKVNDYQLNKAISQIESEVMLVHDEDDKDLPMTEFRKLELSVKPKKVFVSKGFGHDRIIANRQMMLEIIDFLNN
jgi:hypothetical protein